jgi:hypothetical protein
MDDTRSPKKIYSALWAQSVNAIWALPSGPVDTTGWETTTRKLNRHCRWMDDEPLMTTATLAAVTLLPSETS